ncbi:MAG: UvrB/UvrC motif-containing protein [Bacteroides sp.]|nr:UvrB/UvrC motif-containing protein [Prevotella sp.]MCM1407393.1 UvrB/UvrC motif-containing protein [Treponema brennaborense]MCM1469883.1 UvrB/UvrC motif-containing protein [Bacteroides sp.]
MKCDVCKIREAAVFVRQISASAPVDLHLCVLCAKKRGVTASDGKIEMSLGGLLSGLLGSAAQKQLKSCAVCGMTLEELQKQKRCGCPECYKTFKSEIFSVLRAEGISGTFSGSLPHVSHASEDVLSDRMQLQKKLEQAVAVEDYESAAVFRDQLRLLEQGLYACGTEAAASDDETNENADADIMRGGADD